MVGEKKDVFALLLICMYQTVSCFSFVLNQASLALIKDLFVSAIVFGLLVLSGS